MNPTEQQVRLIVREELERFFAERDRLTPVLKAELIEQASPINERQRAAIYAKAGDLARRKKSTTQFVKAAVLAQASAHFGREIGGTSDLSYGEASWVLDRLTDALEAGEE